jgi:anti-sigma B factor antagonist
MTSTIDPFKATLAGTTLVLTALGNLVANNVDSQRASLKEHLGQAKQAVVLDLSSADLVDSLGITLVVGLYKSCKEKGLAFSVAGANVEVLRLFKFFSLNEVFEIRES